MNKIDKSQAREILNSRPVKVKESIVANKFLLSSKAERLESAKKFMESRKNKVKNEAKKKMQRCRMQ